MSAGATVAADSAAATPESGEAGSSAGRGIPNGYAEVDPRTARRVPLTLSLRSDVPSYPGDPIFACDTAFLDTRTADNSGGGYLLERITSLGTHTASHISAPAHFITGGRRLAQLSEDFTLMPLAVIDLRTRIAASGPHFLVEHAELEDWELRHGPLPAKGCVLLLTGNSTLFDQPGGEKSPYVTAPAPGFSGPCVDWLFTTRGTLAIGADSLGPDATSDPALPATTRALGHGGITVENVGPQLQSMRPHGDWIGINGNRPAFSGFQMGFTGYTVP